jgi:hypothetical protein
VRAPNNSYDRQILQAIASHERVTQRSLSVELGVALGLTNLLVRRLVAKGYVKVAGIGTRHVRYLMTPAGWDALGRETRASLENTVHLYTQTREQIRQSLTAVADVCEVDAAGRKGVVFYGAGDVAEIAYVSLQRTDLTLVAVVDDHRQGRFFHMDIRSADCLSADRVDGMPYSRVVIASVRHVNAIQSRLDDRGVPRHRIAYLS